MDLNLEAQIQSAATLSFNEQAALVLKLKEQLEHNQNPNDVLTLLQQLKKRADLFASIDREIDALLAKQAPNQASQALPVSLTMPLEQLNQMYGNNQSIFSSLTTLFADMEMRKALLICAIGWGIARLIATLPVLLILYNINMAYGTDDYVDYIFRILSTVLAAYVTYRTLKLKVPALGKKELMIFVIGMSIGAVLDMPFLTNFGSFVATIVGFMANWAAATITTILVLRRFLSSISSYLSVAVAWGIPYLIMCPLTLAFEPRFSSGIVQYQFYGGINIFFSLLGSLLYAALGVTACTLILRLLPAKRQT
jgi:hypothetical protein